MKEKEEFLFLIFSFFSQSYLESMGRQMQYPLIDLGGGIRIWEEVRWCIMHS